MKGSPTVSKEDTTSVARPADWTKIKEAEIIRELPIKSTPKQTSSTREGGGGGVSPTLDEPIEHWVKKRKPGKKLCSFAKAKHVDVGK